ncbi:RNase adapter RapZ [Oscillibacter hominis]|uniref:RNase adapter RapZ n=1 Tax=Oscillibacter hominis TaxID=2763056 RepID=A0A7G9B7I9_9FIRM|nr:RNase adapter RapZ [Oscillibacter hominis]QNL45520.1 RNase adapter RapZ [Oscillibacter hominis]
MEIVIITGLSGAGKSKAASFLEDMGFYIVDNMPAAMILKFAEFCITSNGRYDRVALVYDVRTSSNFSELFDVLDQLQKMKCTCHTLFLEAAPEILIQRYKESRRLHPLMSGGTSLEEVVGRERELLQPVRERADYLIDTSNLSTGKLRGELLHLFDTQGRKGGMSVNVISFGYKYGIPMEADLVMDVRFLPNPFYVESLRHKTGLDQDVYDYVFSFEQTGELMKHLEELISFALPLYAEEGKTVLVIAIGCTGGHHRSVAVARTLAEYIGRLGYQVSENHRDMTRG